MEFNLVEKEGLKFLIGKKKPGKEWTNVKTKGMKIFVRSPSPRGMKDMMTNTNRYKKRSPSRKMTTLKQPVVNNMRKIMAKTAQNFRSPSHN